jgi:hypothetical protein
MYVAVLTLVFGVLVSVVLCWLFFFFPVSLRAAMYCRLVLVRGVLLLEFIVLVCV